ncbi:MAG: patatin-like phospholipase family protein [Woeseia sp.]
MRIRKWASTAVIGALLAAPALAQDGTREPARDSERPRIGLVLGGGGARGAAHIGVLRELERMRIPVDAIAGTSMGAIVGGLYAAGKTPAELEQIVASIDWDDSFQDEPNRRDLPFRRKQDDAAYPVRFELGVRDGGFQLPRGLVQGQKLGHILRELTSEAAGIRNFDELPIPFRAVASDIETGEPYVMTSGDLPLALRASMSAPGIFSPVVVDGRTLVDGGLVGNVPVNAIRAMNVDVIIAVDVEFPLYEPDQLQSGLDITAQMLTVLINKETRRQIATLDDDDVLLRPALGQFGSTNFGEIMDAIEPGAMAAREHERKLRRYSLTDAAWRAHLAARTLPPRPEGRIDFLRVSDDGPLSARVLRARLDTSVGDPLDPQALASDAGRLFNLDLYEYVDYRIVEEGDETGVEFVTRPKSWGPNYLRFGVGFEDDFEGQTSFNVSTRLTRAGVNRLGAEWRTDLRVGTEPHLQSEFYQPLSFDARYFVAPRINLAQRNLRTFENNVSIARYRVGEAEIGLDAGRELGRWGELRVGAYRGTGSARLKVGDPSLQDIEFENGGVFVNFAVDTLDNSQIPLHGIRAGMRWDMSRPGLGADNSTDTVSTDFTVVDTWGRHTLLLGLEFSSTIETDSQVQDHFSLGGFLRMSGLARGELSGPHAGVGRVVWYRRSGETGGGVFDVPLYFGASLETGNVWQQRSDIGGGDLIVNGSLFAALDTYFGPVFLAAGFAEGGQSNFYLSLGRPDP